MLDFPEQTTDARRQDDGTRKKKSLTMANYRNPEIQKSWNRPVEP